MIMRMYLDEDGNGHLINSSDHIEMAKEMGAEQWCERHLKGRKSAFFHVARDGNTVHIAGEADHYINEDGSIEGLTLE